MYKFQPTTSPTSENEGGMLPSSVEKAIVKNIATEKSLGLVKNWQKKIPCSYKKMPKKLKGDSWGQQVKRK